MVSMNFGSPVMRMFEMDVAYELPLKLFGFGTIAF
jgi:hypothetical protein